MPQIADTWVGLQLGLKPHELVGNIKLAFRFRQLTIKVERRHELVFSSGETCQVSGHWWSLPIETSRKEDHGALLSKRPF